ncbi:MAG: cytochrome c, partial [Bacteroidetes bacterium]
MKKTIAAFALMGALTGLTLLNSCSAPRMATVTGAQLWGENCVRCHNAPPPTDFTDTQWEAVGTHMQLIGHLTNEERDKI